MNTSIYGKIGSFAKTNKHGICKRLLIVNNSRINVCIQQSRRSTFFSISAQEIGTIRPFQNEKAQEAFAWQSDLSFFLIVGKLKNVRQMNSLVPFLLSRSVLYSAIKCKSQSVGKHNLKNIWLPLSVQAAAMLNILYWKQ